jgi:hypothetical protein
MQVIDKKYNKLCYWEKNKSGSRIEYAEKRRPHFKRLLLLFVNKGEPQQLEFGQNNNGNVTQRR